MSRLTIDISPEQHKSLKAMAALEGKTIRQYALERLFPAHRPAAGAELVPDIWAEPPSDPDAPPLPPGHRPILLGELLDKAESGAAMDEEEQAAWASFCAMLEERAARADAGSISDKTVEQIFREVLEEEGHDFG